MDLHQAQDQKTDAYAAADQVAAAGIASMIAAESSLFSAATTAYGNDASALANHTYNPAFTPGEMAPHDPITKDTAGLDPFAPGSGQADAFYGYYNNYYGYTGLIGYGSGYWYGRLGWESFYTQSITPQINLGWYGSGYASGYGYSGYDGTSPTANTGLGTRETQIAGTAGLNSYTLPGLPLTPPDPGFGQGLFNGTAVTQSVPIETMLQYRDQVFAQTGQSSFWADPVAHVPAPDSFMIGPIDATAHAIRIVGF